MALSLESQIDSVIGLVGESLSLVQTTGSTWTTATQIQTTGTLVTTTLTGVLKTIRTGIDGVSVKLGDVDVWISKKEIDGAGVVPSVGNWVVTDSSKFVVLEVTKNANGGYYRCRARAAS